MKIIVHCIIPSSLSLLWWHIFDTSHFSSTPPCIFHPLSKEIYLSGSGGRRDVFSNLYRTRYMLYKASLLMIQSLNMFHNPRSLNFSLDFPLSLFLSSSSHIPFLLICNSFSISLTSLWWYITIEEIIPQFCRQIYPPSFPPL